MLFSFYNSPDYASSGVSSVLIAQFQPHIVAYKINDKINAISKELTFEKVPCNVATTMSEESADFSGNYNYQVAVPMILKGVARNVANQFNGKRVIVVAQFSDEKWYIIGLNSGVRLTQYNTTPGDGQTESATNISLTGLQRKPFEECTLEFVEDVLLGGIVNAPENLEAFQ